MCLSLIVSSYKINSFFPWSPYLQSPEKNTSSQNSSLLFLIFPKRTYQKLVPPICFPIASAMDEHLEIQVYCPLLVTALRSHGIIFCLDPNLSPCEDPQLTSKAEHLPSLFLPQSPACFELPFP